jgi:hypothetical protein
VLAKESAAGSQDVVVTVTVVYAVR